MTADVRRGDVGFYSECAGPWSRVRLPREHEKGERRPAIVNPVDFTGAYDDDPPVRDPVRRGQADDRETKRA